MAIATSHPPSPVVRNVPRRRIDVYTEPTGPAATPTYCVLRICGPGEVAPVVLDGREVGRIAVRDVLL